MHFVKMHGSGNDFIVVEGRVDERDWPATAIKLCDRHFGIGADGILLVTPSQRAPLGMRVFNSDGSEAEMCGNGIRCVGKFAVERGLVSPESDEFGIETLIRVVSVRVYRRDGVVERVRVGLGKPEFAPSQVPVCAEGAGPVIDLPVEIGGAVFPATCVSMGNPHAVHFLDRPVSEFPLEEIGPSMAMHPVFPRGTNFEVARVLDREHIEARVWERGAGLTLACGSGASATMVSARLHGLVGDKVDITLPGGTLTLEWDGKGEVYLSGPAVEVFEGEVDVEEEK